MEELTTDLHQIKWIVRLLVTTHVKTIYKLRIFYGRTPMPHATAGVGLMICIYVTAMVMDGFATR